MYAIIAASGKQFRAEEGKSLTIDHIDAEVGQELTFDQVLMIGGDEVKVGAPTVDGAKVIATVTAHKRGDKVITFKYNRRHRTRRRVGFRHTHTVVEIIGIQA